MAKNDRGRSLLTPEQREYLEGDREVSQERTYRTRLRDRVVDGLRDFEYLADPELFPDGEIETMSRTKDVNNSDRSKIPILREGGISHEEVFDPLFRDLLVEMAGFIYRAAPGDDAFERVVAEGRGKVRRRYWNPEAVADRIREKVEADEPITDDELRFAITQGVLPLKEIADHVKERETWLAAELEEMAEDMGTAITSDKE